MIVIRKIDRVEEKERVLLGGRRRARVVEKGDVSD